MNVWRTHQVKSRVTLRLTLGSSHSGSGGLVQVLSSTPEGGSSQYPCSHYHGELPLRLSTCFLTSSSSASASRTTNFLKPMTLDL